MSTAGAQRLLQGPIVPTLARLAAPGALLALFQSAVSIADTYFVGQLGTDALAGLALVFPLVMLLQMLSAGAMGGGVSSALARALGAGREDAAKSLIAHALVPAVALAAAAVVQIPLSGALTLGWGPFPRLGIVGAALAYVAAFLVASLLMGASVWRGGLRPRRAHWRLEWRVFREILRVGAVSSVGALQTVLAAVVLTASSAASAPRRLPATASACASSSCRSRSSSPSARRSSSWSAPTSAPGAARRRSVSPGPARRSPPASRSPSA